MMLRLWEEPGQFDWILLFPPQFSSLLSTPQRQPELITSECTPPNDGWALAMGLSGEGAGPYGSGIWKPIAEDGAKRRGVTEMYIKDTALLLEMQGSSV